MQPKRRAILIAIVMVCLIAGSLFLYVPYVGVALMGLSFVAFMYLGATLLRGDGEKRYRDPYDLDLLKEIHERASWEEADITVPEEADAVCPHCGHVYGHEFKVCPQCKRMP